MRKIIDYDWSISYGLRLTVEYGKNAREIICLGVANITGHQEFELG